MVMVSVSDVNERRSHNKPGKVITSVSYVRRCVHEGGSELYEATAVITQRTTRIWAVHSCDKHDLCSFDESNVYLIKCTSVSARGC